MNTHPYDPVQPKLVQPDAVQPGVHRRGRWASAGVWTAGLAVAVAAAIATAHGLYEVVRASGGPPFIAGLYPLITDGLALVAYSATAKLTGHGRRYAWIIVVLAAGLSGLAQATYLAGGVHTAPGWLRAGVGGWPAIAAAIVAHLLYLLASSDRDSGMNPLPSGAGHDLDEISTSSEAEPLVETFGQLDGLDGASNGHPPGVDTTSNGHRPSLDEPTGRLGQPLDRTDRTKEFADGLDGPSTHRPTGVRGARADGVQAPVPDGDAAVYDRRTVRDGAYDGSVQPYNRSVRSDGTPGVGPVQSGRPAEPGAVRGVQASNGHEVGHLDGASRLDGASNGRSYELDTGIGRLDTSTVQLSNPAADGRRHGQNGSTSIAGGDPSAATQAGAKERALAAARQHEATHGELPSVNQLAQIAEVARGTAGNALKQLRHT